MSASKLLNHCAQTPLSKHLDSSVFLLKATKKPRKKKLKVCPFKFLQPARLSGFALTACLLLNMKREAAWTEIKASCSAECSTCAQASRAGPLCQSPWSWQLCACCYPPCVCQPLAGIPQTREDLSKLHVLRQT